MNIHRLYLDSVSVGLGVEFLCISFFSFILNRLALYFLQSVVFPINLLTVKVKNTLMSTTVALKTHAKSISTGLPSISLDSLCNISKETTSLRWLKTVSSTFQDLDFDVSL